MWRAFFLAVGTYCVLLGAQCLVIERAILNAREDDRGGVSFFSAGDGQRNKELAPPEWAPWTFMSIGAVTILYSFTIPARKKQ
jgi:hypothetical protein